ncbi:AAA family ATPase [Paracoccaceae bacterium Fryx2]|nr:AAA family ATPase [Paracoccaceae bacterium Fryx2]
MQPQAPDTQSEVTAFLQSAAAWPGGAPVSHIETHGAHVFLSGTDAIKIKRAVRYDYMDLSTLARREAMLRRELALNRDAAPMIYRDVVAITRDKGGRLGIAGEGEAVEWALRMHRFPAECELTAIAERGGLTDAIVADLGRVIAAYHAQAPKRDLPGDRLIEDILAELARVFAGFGAEVGEGAIAAFLDAARGSLETLRPTLRARTGAGDVRRVHGDLHLRNIVLLDGQPVLFDALEFDETLGTCDVLYDLAFLVMDLWHRDLRAQANGVLSAWLLHAGGRQDAGLVTLPLFLAVRAAIRAMVTLQTDRATQAAGTGTPEARRYLAEAVAALAPARPCLIAIGGVSGTGKTVLARGVAPLAGACPGAVHLRSDTLRKAGDAAPQYDPGARAAVYAAMLARARTILSARQSVVLDATFLDPEQRAAARSLAQSLGLPFHGLWLAAPEATLLARVGARQGDASDADAPVVRAQLAGQPAAPDWTQIDASRTPEATAAAARAALAAVLPGAVVTTDALD